MRKPFFRTDKKCWYVKDSNGKFIRLSKDKDEAHEIWAVMVSRRDISQHNPTFRAVAEEFLRHLELEVSPKFLARMAAYFGYFLEEFGEIRMKDINSSDLLMWTASPKPHKGARRAWGKASRKDVITAFKRLFRWAMERQIITVDRICHLRCESPPPRDTLISQETHNAMIKACMAHRKSRCFALYLMACRSGARPGQIRELRRRNVAPSGDAWVFQDHKTRRKTGAPLVVYLSPCLQTLTKILSHHRRDHLFLNSTGKPWRHHSVAARFTALREKLGVEGRLYNYAYRHTFATEALLAGNHIATVAKLLGHTGTEMVSRVYGHLDQHQDHLLDAVVKTARRQLSS
jgi:integrase